MSASTGSEKTQSESRFFDHVGRISKIPNVGFQVVQRLCVIGVDQKLTHSFAENIQDQDQSRIRLIHRATTLTLVGRITIFEKKCAQFASVVLV